MGLPQWSERSFELAGALLELASQKFANPHLSDEGKLRASRLMAGCSWSKRVMETVASNKLSGVIRRSFRNPSEKLIAKASRNRLHSVWFVLHWLTEGNPHEWRDVLATSGLSGGASEETWGKLSAELGEIVIFASGNLAQVGARHLYVISESPESNQLLGQLWKASKSSRGARDFFRTERNV